MKHQTELEKIVAARNAKLAAAKKPVKKQFKAKVVTTGSSDVVDIVKKIPLSAIRQGGSFN